MAVDRIPLTISAWKAKLLDLTKRNRALNFKPNKVSTVTIVDEQPPEVFRILCLEGRTMRFKASAQTVPVTTGASEVSEASDEVTQLSLIDYDEDESGLDLETPDLIPYDASALGDHHTDDYLQTNSPPDRLDKSLRRIEEQSRLAQEEQGVNTLFLSLGMLLYNETEESTTYFRAPLILVPIQMERKSARSAYSVSKSDDEVIVNPSLAEYLRRNFGINAPEIPDSDSLSPDYDLQTFFADFSKAIANQTTWSIRNEMFLTLFSFQKLVMYKDLERNAHALGNHELIRKMILRTGDVIVGLPNDIRDLNLDENFAPEATAQVVDADSSQLRAIAAVAKNHDLVLEGPPGTGKSQTITNLIAQNLSQGKSVLFVAEKMAALEVVERRLKAAGLGEFCLELHSTKANKRSVMNEIRNSLDASLQGIANSRSAASRLPVVRQHLSKYVSAVHQPYGNLGQAPYQAYGELEAVFDAPKVQLEADILPYKSEVIRNDLRDVADLVVTAKPIGTPDQHAWRSSRKTFFAENDLDRIETLLNSLKLAIEEIAILAPRIEESFGLPSITTLKDVEIASSIAHIFAASPGAPKDVLSSDAWNSPPLEAASLIDRVRKAQTLKSRILEMFSPETLDSNPEEDIAYVERKKSGLMGFVAFLDSRFRSIKRRWSEQRTASYDGDILQQAYDLRQVVQYLDYAKLIGEAHDVGRSLFGVLWRGDSSNPVELEHYVRWVTEFRRICLQHGLQSGAIETASHPSPDTKDVEGIKTLSDQVLNSLRDLSLVASFAESHFDGLAISELRVRVDELRSNLGSAPTWASFASALAKVEKGVAADLLPLAMAGDLAFTDIDRAFRRAFYQKWLAHVLSERPELLEFHTISHEERVKEFRQIDEQVLIENRSDLISQLRERLQNKLRDPDVQNGMTFLRRELARQRGLSPLRTTVKNAYSAIRAIKPCFLMGPQTVAQLLDNPDEKFDLVIFDEASQLPTEEAVGAVMRGKQLAVVGDPKQLPPTNFFAVQSGHVNVQLGDDGLPLVEDTQSILEEVMGSGVPYARLKWHYRSAHESLINFSNVHFYDSELFTFPSVETNSTESGIHFEYVSDGVYEGSGLNRVEARKVADAVVDHIKMKPDLSLGVGTFNLRQQLAIQDELEVRRRNDPTIEHFFNKGKLEPFFVKNLENIQGDERDTIFLSVTYAKGIDGRMRYNLGPLNGENGWRRLNVLTTRARKMMRVFSSVRGDEINPAALASRGPQLLKDFLTYAEHKRLDSPKITAHAETESPFERQVLQVLENLGYNVEPQIGVCGYRIDLAVLDKEVPGRFICGIECDGVSYHESQTARDRDRLRQQVLEGRGWEIHRIWSTDWFKDRAGQIRRIRDLIDQSAARARNEYQSEKQLRDNEKNDHDKFIRDTLTHGVAGIAELASYVRPVAEDYVFAESIPFSVYGTVTNSPSNSVARVLMTVVDVEGPIHFNDLSSRVASFWGQQRAGNAIRGRVQQVAKALEHAGHLYVRGEFVWNLNGGVKIRSRRNAGIPAERIAPEEINAAVLRILDSGHSFTRQDLVNEVRAVFGFARTGPSLKQAIDTCVEGLLESGSIGEGSIGIAIRRSTNVKQE